MAMTETNDDRLWRIARKRADFRRNLYSYVAVNLFLWLVWWFTTGRITGFNGYPWPIWVMLGWGLSLAKQYFDAYKGDKKDLADEEYEKLKRQQEGR
jgi:hypothetical protein